MRYEDNTEAPDIPFFIALEKSNDLYTSSVCGFVTFCLCSKFFSNYPFNIVCCA